ncbi:MULTISPECIES: hypothetical protein [unclassified Rhodococcus (in: high G+C Gram-positive bacteria)]|nr:MULTISPECIES: hypothetical protein [unclassified Rhodococcus (in: high G+C Gram-positive bacteria)]
MAEQFPTVLGTVGFGLPNPLRLVLFGGTTPLLVEWRSCTGAS